MTSASTLHARADELDARIARHDAEAIEQFGEDLAKLLKALDREVSAAGFDHFNQIEGVGELDTVAAACRALGDRLCRDCDAAEEAEDRRRDNPLEPDFRRLV